MEQQQQQLQSGQSDEQQQQQSVSETTQSASLVATSEAKLRTLHNKVYSTMFTKLCSGTHRSNGELVVVVVVC
jgi:type VI protein secretion system component Hcp